MRAHRSRSILSVVALAASVAATAGPASAGTLTKGQVIARGTAICKAAERKVDALPQIRSQHPFSKQAPTGDRERAIHFLGGYADALEGVRVGLAGLSLPTEGRPLLVRFISDLRPTIATFRKAHGDATAGRYAASEAETQRAFALFTRASRMTAAYGFPKGVCQAGSSG